jgi:hypothetical protein
MSIFKILDQLDFKIHEVDKKHNTLGNIIYHLKNN